MRNPWRAVGLPGGEAAGIPRPAVDAAPVARLLARCPVAEVTPLVEVPRLARRLGIAGITLKDERRRMGLGSFKALGAAYAIARAAEAAGGSLSGQTYVTASAGNHGLSVAAGARVFGAQAVIFLAETVPEAFADRLRAEGARVVREGADYEAGMAAAARAAAREGWILLSDSSWLGYLELPWRVMEGYLQMAAEIVPAIAKPPTHLFLQAGVGGMAAAVAAHARAVWGDAPRIITVEPQAAPALAASIRAGRAVHAPGPVSAMGRLDCKDPSLIALAALARDGDDFVTVTEEEAAAGVAALDAEDLETTPSGAAGVSALLAAASCAADLGLAGDSRVLAVLTEGAEEVRARS